MTQPCERRTESEYEERRDLYEQAVQDRERFTEAPGNLSELDDAIKSMQKHFANLDAMPADYQDDRYTLAGWLMWARRDLELAVKIMEEMIPKKPAIVTPQELIETGQLPF